MRQVDGTEMAKMANEGEALCHQDKEALDNGKAYNDDNRPIPIGTDGWDNCWTVTPWQEIAKDFFKRWLPWGRK